MKRVLLMAAAAASLAACSSMGARDPMIADGAMPMADPSMPMATPMPGMVMPTQAQAYLRAAGESDLFEVTSSQLALTKTQNPDIRAYATMMIDHHTKTTNDALAAAKAGRVPPPPAVLGPQKRAMIQQLDGQTGTAFDQLYVRQQVMGHQEALGIHTSYSQSGDVPTLRAAATAVIPIVQAHLTRVQAMQTAMGGSMAGM